MRHPSATTLVLRRGLSLLFLAASVGACSGEDDPSTGDGSGGSGGQDGGGDAGADGGPEPPEVTYSVYVRPIFQSKCVFCHRAESAVGIDLDNPFDPEFGIIGRENTWASQGAQASLLVDPGNVENSFLVTKVEREDLDPNVEGAPMPLIVPRLDEAEIAAVEQWIVDGAADDEFFRETVAPIFGTEVTLGAAAGKCTFCHYPGTPYPMSVVDVFDPETGMVDVDSAYGGKIVAPGEPENSSLMQKIAAEEPLGAKMPLAAERLTTREVEVLKAWIAAGARDD